MTAATATVPAVEVNYVSNKRVLHIFCSNKCEEEFTSPIDGTITDKQRVTIALEDLPVDCRCAHCAKGITTSIAEDIAAKKAHSRYNTPRMMRIPPSMTAVEKVLNCKALWALPGLDHYICESNQEAIRRATAVSKPKPEEHACYHEEKEEEKDEEEEDSYEIIRAALRKTAQLLTREVNKLDKLLKSRK